MSFVFTSSLVLVVVLGFFDAEMVEKIMSQKKETLAIKEIRRCFGITENTRDCAGIQTSQQVCKSLLC